jgi:glycosyltransferase involved in cell wall biosynthesis
MAALLAPKVARRGKPQPAAEIVAEPRRDVDIVVPVYNEGATLERSIRQLHRFLVFAFPFSWRIVIADNASTDDTFEVAERLTGELWNVDVLHLEDKGRGRALRAAWSEGDARVLCYMDVDLSTDLRALLPLVAPLLSSHSDVAIGTRLHRDANIVRSRKREFISRVYNGILRVALRARFSDAQCGFKAIRADVAEELLRDVRDEAWFFDTELLVLAQRKRLRIHEVPVDWGEDDDSRVRIVSTAIADLRGVARLLLGGLVVRFALIGLVSTAAYAVLFSLLRGALPASAANILALAVTAVANTAANRSFTFGVRGAKNLVRHQLQGLVVFLLAVVVTSGSLLALHVVDPSPGRLVELAVLVAASVVATLVRYLGLRRWVFRERLLAVSKPSPTQL